MTNLVPSDVIESVVGAKRHPMQHLARAVASEQKVYILHSQHCIDTHTSLVLCPYSLALDKGIDMDDWNGFEDKVVVVAIIHDRLFPVIPNWLE